MSTATMLAARSFRAAAAQVRTAPIRFTHSGVGAGKKSGVLMTAVGVAGAIGSYAAYNRYKNAKWTSELPGIADVLLQKVSAASDKYPPSQASVFSQPKEHALYLWIHLTPKADAKKCAKVVADIQGHADAVSPADLRDEDNEVIAGVGFGPEFYAKISPNAPVRQNFTYRYRKGPLGVMPATGGDIFIHAKSNSVSKLFELAQRVLGNLPDGSVAKFEDVYSFVYQNGRDLSGFIDGTENPADEDDRQAVAVEVETGGSYVITQKWIHRLDFIGTEKHTNLEKFVGRSKEDSVELKNKPISSHVARMTGGTAQNQVKPFQIVRQSMPYGNLHDKAGLFFIAYAASPNNFNYMLDRMVGADSDGHSDDIMRLSECVSSTFWYFPGLNELKKFK